MKSKLLSIPHQSVNWRSSSIVMLQLAQDTELKAAAERLMAALKAAGISVDPHQALEALKTMGGEGFNNVGKDGKGEDDK